MSLPRSVQSLIAVLLLLYPSFALVHRSGASATLHIIALIGLVWMVYSGFKASGRGTLSAFWRNYGLLCVAMLSPLAVSLISSASSGSFDDAFSTTVQRSAFGVFVLYVLAACSRVRLARIQWGLLAGPLVAVLVLLAEGAASGVRPSPAAQNLLNYTNFVVLLGVFSLYMLCWRLGRFMVAEAFIKLLAFALAVYAVFLSQSRGPLLALCLLLAFYFVFGVRAFGWRRRVVASVLALLLAGVLVAQSDTLRVRFQQSVSATLSSVPALLQGQDPVGGDASTRTRFGFMKASWLMFKEHPWVGDSSRSFAERLAALNQAGLINDETTWRPNGTPFVQPHNEIANAAATRGVAGLLSLLLLYAVPLYYFIRQRSRTDAFGRVAADMGIATCVGVMFFGLTVTVFTSGWMVVHYVLLVSVFVVLSRPSPADDDVPQMPLTSTGHVPFPPVWAQKHLRRTVRALRGRANRHNAHLWPYVSITRDRAGYITRMAVQGYDIPLTRLDDAFASMGDNVHIVLSGPSVAGIDYARLPRLQAMGVNGSILLQDRADIDFPFYCLIDRTFVRNRPDVVDRIVSEQGRVLFVTPDVVRYICDYVPLDRIRCRICLIEDIAEAAYKPACSPASLKALQAAGRDILVFDEQVPLGFSFDPCVGWFDADTVAYVALQVAVWGGARRIYFHGLDIKGAALAPRFYHEGNRPLGSRLEQNFDRLIEPSFRQAVAHLRERGVEVYNLSPDSALRPDVMPHIPWQKLL